MFVFLMPGLTFLGVGLLVLLMGRLLMGRPNADVEVSKLRSPVFGRLTLGLAGVVPMSQAKKNKIRRELKQAGYYHPLALEEFLAIRNALATGWIVLVGTAIVAAFQPNDDPTPQIAIAGAMVLAILYAAPRLWLQSAAARRLGRIQQGLPDALDMITMCLSGGLPLQQAMNRVSGEIRSCHPDFAFEMEVVRRQADAFSLDRALDQFADRIDLPEVNSLTAIVAQTERLGTNVATALRDYADSMRRNHRQRAEERGNKASVKMLFPVVLCLAPPVYILLLAPAMLEIREFFVRENQTGGILSPPDMDNALGVARRNVEE
jgi:tight adherence protein C